MDVGLQDIYLNDILLKVLGRTIKQLSSGSELLLYYELCKYARKSRFNVVLGDIEVDSRFSKSAYFSFVRDSGVSLPKSLYSLDTAEYTEAQFFTGSLEKLIFYSQTDEEWVFYAYCGDYENKDLLYPNFSQALISLWAMVLMYNYFHDTHVRLVIKEVAIQSLNSDYAELFVLKCHGNKLASMESLRVEYSEVDFQPEWSAFHLYYNQMGYMNRVYSSYEKYELLRKNFVVGDVVLLYTRKAKKKSNKVRNLNFSNTNVLGELVSCFPAVIQDIRQDSIRLNYYTFTDSKLTLRRKYEKAKEDSLYEISSIACESLFTPDDYNKFPVINQTYSLYNLGVDVYTYNEGEFIFHVLDDDGKFEYLSNGVDEEYVFLNTPDIIYTVFEENHVKYNKERFLSKYFRRKEPFYESYQNRR